MSELVPGTVTVADLYRELVGMRQDVGKALVRIEVIDSRNKDADGLHADHEQRLRALEAFRWKLAGLAMSVSVLAGVLSGVLANYVH
jgi:hypothetical protein